MDASALIYLVDGEATWAEATQATLHQLAVEAPDLALAVSRLSLLECRVAPLRRSDQASLDRFEALFAQPDLLVVELSALIRSSPCFVGAPWRDHAAGIPGSLEGFRQLQRLPPASQLGAQP